MKPVLNPQQYQYGIFEECENGWIRLSDAPNFGTPSSDNYDTSLETLKTLMIAIKLKKEQDERIVWDPYYHTGLAGQYWHELDFNCYHMPLDFFLDSSIPLHCYNPTIEEGSEYDVLITKWV